VAKNQGDLVCIKRKNQAKGRGSIGPERGSKRQANTKQKKKNSLRLRERKRNIETLNQKGGEGRALRGGKNEIIAKG